MKIFNAGIDLMTWCNLLNAQPQRKFAIMYILLCELDVFYHATSTSDRNAT